MAKRMVIQPEMLDLPTGPVTSKLEARIRSCIPKENTSSIFTHIQKVMGGGRVLPLRGGYDTIKLPTDKDEEEPEIRYFRPDIVHIRETGFGYTEVKAVSTRSSHPECTVNQLENNAFALLFRRDAGDTIPWVDYVFFRYGNRNLNGLYKHQNGQLISKISEVVRDSLTTPFNLTLFMLLNSPSRSHDQTSSGSSVNERDYWYVRSSVLNFLHKMDPPDAIEAIMKNGVVLQRAKRKTKEKLKEELFLNQLEVERTTSPEMYTPKGKIFKPFPVTKYSLPAKDYQAWLDHFSENHGRILARLGVRDLFGELDEFGGPGAVTFGQRASYVTKNAEVPF